MPDHPAQHEVLLTQGAEQDLEAIFDFIADHDGMVRAHQVLDELMATVDSLAHFPERGHHPKELLDLGIREVRQTSFKPYRMIYRVSGHRVVVYLIADGRRNMQALLTRRLLRP